MAQSYVPEGAMVVCTQMQTPKDNSVIAMRFIQTVNHSNKQAVLLNKDDLKLKDAFICTNKSKFWGGLKMLGAVVAFGALAVATVATGGVALLALGVAVAATATTATAVVIENHHDCDVTKESKWIEYHPTVRFNKANALLQGSTLICNKAGAMMDPVLAKAAAKRFSDYNKAEYQSHILSQTYQGIVFLIAAKGDAKGLAVGYPFLIYDYVTGENEKTQKRLDALEDIVRGEKEIEPTKGFLEGAADVIIGELEKAPRDILVGVVTDATLNYSGVLIASVGSQYPEAALRLNTSLYLTQVRNSFSKNFKGVLKDGAKGVGWGIVGSGIDAVSDNYEDEMYNSNLKYLLTLMKDNLKSKGINVIAKKE